MVTVAPSRASRRRSAGIAVISLDLASVATWPSTRPLAVAQALTRCSASLPVRRSCDRRRVLASTATTCSPGAPTTARTQRRKQRRISSGSSRPNTRPNVAWDGIPPGSARNVLSHACCSRPKVSTATQSSAPQSTAQSAMVTISTSGCTFDRSTRGSVSVAKCSLMLVDGSSTTAGPPRPVLTGREAPLSPCDETRCDSPASTPRRLLVAVHGVIDGLIEELPNDADELQLLVEVEGGIRKP
jgi:hypothetical protein